MRCNQSYSHFVCFYSINEILRMWGCDVIASVEQAGQGDRVWKLIQGSCNQFYSTGAHKICSSRLCLSSFQLYIRQHDQHLSHVVYSLSFSPEEGACVLEYFFHWGVTFLKSHIACRNCGFIISFCHLYEP